MPRTVTPTPPLGLHSLCDLLIWCAPTNETPKALVEAIGAKELGHGAMPKANHRRGPAERAIQAFESHST